MLLEQPVEIRNGKMFFTLSSSSPSFPSIIPFSRLSPFNQSNELQLYLSDGRVIAHRTATCTNARELLRYDNVTTLSRKINRPRYKWFLCTDLLLLVTWLFLSRSERQTQVTVTESIKTVSHQASWVYTTHFADGRR